MLNLGQVTECEIINIVIILFLLFMFFFWSRGVNEQEGNLV